MNKTTTKNLHLNHPEDMILTGNLEVLNWFSEPDSFISTKIDGSPAIVWGTNPQNGKFFVCTKAAFNKKKIRLCYNEDDIFTHFGHQERVAQILRLCLKYLPKTDAVMQGDWIGPGGSDTYTPNTITYTFPQVISQKIIVAPHTIYSGSDDIREMNAAPLTSKLISTDGCLFVQPEVELNQHREDIEYICKFARQMSTLCDFLDNKKSAEVKKVINTYIREDKQLDEYEISETCGVDINLMRLYKLVMSIKLDMFFFIEDTDYIDCHIGGKPSAHEGFVMTNKFGTYKIVDRYEFSRSNFLMEKSWC